MLTLVPGVVGGSETYARALCRGLARVDEVDATAFLPTLAPDAGGDLPTVVVDEYRASTSTPGRLAAMVRGSVASGSLRTPFAGLDVVHYPLTTPIPPLDLPTVVTLHDVQHLDLPQLFGRGERLFRRVFYDRASRRADLVLVPSEFVRERAIARLGLDPARVRVCPHGVDHDAFRPGDGGRERFLLYPAKTWPHKNHERLLAAFALLHAEEPDLRLVLTGGGTEKLAGPLGVEARGLVPADELAGLFRRAAALVFPSLHEGFGTPVLEAMASGTPVAAARAGSLPEVCGDAAVLFDPQDPEAIAAGVREALSRSDELRAAGIARAATFTWEASARSHADAYREASTRS